MKKWGAGAERRKGREDFCPKGGTHLFGAYSGLDQGLRPREARRLRYRDRTYSGTPWLGLRISVVARVLVIATKAEHVELLLLGLRTRP